MPSNAGRYITKKYKIGEGLFPSNEVIDVGKSYWKNHLVGFFFDKNFPYHIVVNHLLRV